MRVIERGREAAIHHKAGRARTVGVEHLHPISERARCHCCHAPKLSPTKDANGCARKNGTHEGSSVPRTSFWRARRQARMRSRRSALLRAQIEAASKAAFAA